MFVIESCQKIEYNALFMRLSIPVSNFGNQPLGKYIDNLQDRKLGSANSVWGHV